MIREACGVVGVRAPGQPVAHLTYLGLHALQHRGQESAGMAVSDGRTLTVVKDMGLVASVFSDRTLAGLPGHLSVGHTRYSTTGASTWRAAQPAYRPVGAREFALGHNGNLVNTAELAERAGIPADEVVSDSDVVAELLASAVADLSDDGAPGGPLVAALLALLPALRGSFSMVALDARHLVGVRDPNGFRPLVLGRLPDGGVVLASESPAVEIMGGTVEREVEPGELVVVDEAGEVRSLRPFPPERVDPALCVFEFVYFARPDARLLGSSVHQARQRMGERLAEQAPLPPSSDADGAPAMVMPVPESGIPAAQGFARAAGLPYGDGLVKNRYIGRTFIAPNQELRARSVRLKLSVLRENVAGKRLVVVDDSIVRGTTTREMVRLLREAGAAEVHLRVSSPPYRWPCWYGMDTGDRDELLAARLEVDEIGPYLGVDSLSYLDLDGLLAATGAPADSFCSACLTGRYPVEVPVAAPVPGSRRG